MSGIHDYWRNLEPRERRVFGVGGALAALILFYTLVWDPWHVAIHHLRRAVPEKFETLVWLDRQKGEVAQLRRANAGKQTGKPASLLSYIEQTAANTGLRKNLEIVPGRGGEIRISLKTVPFNRALVFVRSLMQGGVELKTVLLKKTKSEGQVDVTISAVN